MSEALHWLFVTHGRKVVAAFCSWELVGLVPGSPVPTISEVVGLGGLPGVGLGIGLLVGLAVHWWGPRP